LAPLIVIFASSIGVHPTLFLVLLLPALRIGRAPAPRLRNALLVRLVMRALVLLGLLKFLGALCVEDAHMLQFCGEFFFGEFGAGVCA
jgi:hypothetical protein